MRIQHDTVMTPSNMARVTDVLRLTLALTPCLLRNSARALNLFCFIFKISQFQVHIHVFVLEMLTEFQTALTRKRLRVNV